MALLPATPTEWQQCPMRPPFAPKINLSRGFGSRRWGLTVYREPIKSSRNAPLLKLADRHDLGSCAERRVGSNPSGGTSLTNQKCTSRGWRQYKPIVIVQASASDRRFNSWPAPQVSVYRISWVRSLYPMISRIWPPNPLISGFSLMTPTTQPQVRGAPLLMDLLTVLLNSASWLSCLRRASLSRAGSMS